MNGVLRLAEFTLSDQRESKGSLRMPESLSSSLKLLAKGFSAVLPVVTWGPFCNDFRNFFRTPSEGLQRLRTASVDLMADKYTSEIPSYQQGPDAYLVIDQQEAFTIFGILKSIMAPTIAPTAP